jgi:sorbose PTS system EIIB component
VPVLLARVDDRLIHGQVVVGWAQALKATHICVVNDEAAASEMQKSLFRMATPSDIKLTVMTVAQGAGALKSRAFDDDETIVLFKRPQDALAMMKSGGKMPELNIGGMHFVEGKAQIFDAIFMDADDIECFAELNRMKISLEVRMVPTDSKKEVIRGIEEKINKKK